MKTGGPPCTFTISLTECPGLVDHYILLVLLLLACKSSEGRSCLIENQRFPCCCADFIDFDQIVITIVEQHGEVLRQDW